MFSEMTSTREEPVSLTLGTRSVRSKVVPAERCVVCPISLILHCSFSISAWNKCSLHEELLLKFWIQKRPELGNFLGTLGMGPHYLRICSCLVHWYQHILIKIFRSTRPTNISIFKTFLRISDGRVYLQTCFIIYDKNLNLKVMGSQTTVHFLWHC